MQRPHLLEEQREATGSECPKQGQDGQEKSTGGRPPRGPGGFAGHGGGDGFYLQDLGKSSN